MLGLSSSTTCHSAHPLKSCRWRSAPESALDRAGATTCRPGAHDRRRPPPSARGYGDEVRCRSTSPRSWKPWRPAHGETMQCRGRTGGATWTSIARGSPQRCLTTRLQRASLPTGALQANPLPHIGRITPSMAMAPAARPPLQYVFRPSSPRRIAQRRHRLGSAWASRSRVATWRSSPRRHVAPPPSPLGCLRVIVRIPIERSKFAHGNPRPMGVSDRGGRVSPMVH